MTLFSALGLISAMFILAITPGPGVLAVVSKALASGFKQTLPVVAGIILGDLIFLLLALGGLSTIAETFGALLTTIKYLGGGYLIWLGVKAWRTTPQVFDDIELEPQPNHLSLMGGLFITLSNPKVILFYIGFLPTFLDLEQLSLLDVIWVTGIVSSVLGAVMMSYAFTAAKARQTFKSAPARKTMNQAAGTVMVGAGAILLAKS